MVSTPFLMWDTPLPNSKSVPLHKRDGSPLVESAENVSPGRPTVQEPPSGEFGDSQVLGVPVIKFENVRSIVRSLGEILNRKRKSRNPVYHHIGVEFFVIPSLPDYRVSCKRSSPPV